MNWVSEIVHCRERLGRSVVQDDDVVLSSIAIPLTALDGVSSYASTSRTGHRRGDTDDTGGASIPIAIDILIVVI